MKVILSIKPIYAEKILNGEKIFELRKSIFRKNNIEKVIIYASSPISKVIGEFEIDSILHHDINELWKKTKENNGVGKSFFNEYFENREKGYAIKIKNTKRYKIHYDIYDKYGIKPPQSFSYVED
ncbi:ASCH domain-containing protein [uncultured Chryseobacterium sp.]|uniref:ASCH domain-containing protein n=1 Tax=uncultured Chryseobacterium sp. TaxID=259322 RepID=UPI0025F09170|nr:ASCH domain-containing protein [uncultured Chryseobacterium sp.]